MPSDISLRPSKIDDSWHAFKGGSCIASGSYKAVLIDARLALGPGEHIVRGSSIAMRHPAPPAPEAPKAAPKKARKPKARKPRKSKPKAEGPVDLG